MERSSRTIDNIAVPILSPLSTSTVIISFEESPISPGPSPRSLALASESPSCAWCLRMHTGTNPPIFKNNNRPGNWGVVILASMYCEHFF